jgi:hypothetical protein
MSATTDKSLFVSYAHKSASGFGYGNATIHYPYFLKDGDDINRIGDAIKEQTLEQFGYPPSDVVILGWQRMETS